MNKNREFFSGKTWEQIFDELKFEKHLKKLSRKLKGKKIGLYGAGIMLDYVMENFDTSKFNIDFVSDKRFQADEGEYFGIRGISPQKMPTQNTDVIIICTQYPFAIYKYLKKEVYQNKKMPKIYFLLNKPFALYIEEIFDL